MHVLTYSIFQNIHFVLPTKCAQYWLRVCINPNVYTLQKRSGSSFIHHIFLQILSHHRSRILKYSKVKLKKNMTKAYALMPACLVVFMMWCDDWWHGCCTHHNDVRSLVLAITIRTTHYNAKVSENERWEWKKPPFYSQRVWPRMRKKKARKTL